MEIIQEISGSTLILKSPEGYKITNYKDGEDIRNYSSFEIAFLNKDSDISMYKLIDLAADSKYCTEQEETLLKDYLEEMQKLQIEKMKEYYDIN